MFKIPFGTASIGRDNDCIAIVYNLVLDVFNSQRLTEEVVNWDIKESLVLCVVQVHCNDMIGT